MPFNQGYCAKFMYFEPLSSCKVGFIDCFCDFIQNLLSTLCDVKPMSELLRLRIDRWGFPKVMKCYHCVNLFSKFNFESSCTYDLKCRGLDKISDWKPSLKGSK